MLTRGKFTGLSFLTLQTHLIFNPDCPGTTPCIWHEPTCLANSTTDPLFQFPRHGTVGRVSCREGSLMQGSRFRMCPCTYSYNSPDFSWGFLPVCGVGLLSLVHSCSFVTKQSNMITGFYWSLSSHCSPLCTISPHSPLNTLLVS